MQNAVSSVLKEAISACELETEKLKWWIESRRYNPAAAKSLQFKKSSPEWTLSYRFHGKSADGRKMPSPEDIAYACQCINEERCRDYQGGGYSGEEIMVPSVIKSFSDPQVISRYQQSEDETQLCDCPYWGTEFNEQKKGYW